eukprot:6182497-Pleurochrysis_carterae.AAC.1
MTGNGCATLPVVCAARSAAFSVVRAGSSILVVASPPSIAQWPCVALAAALCRALCAVPPRRRPGSRSVSRRGQERGRLRYVSQHSPEIRYCSFARVVMMDNPCAGPTGDYPIPRVTRHYGRTPGPATAPQRTSSLANVWYGMVKTPRLRM